MSDKEVSYFALKGYALGYHYGRAIGSSYMIDDVVNSFPTNQQDIVRHYFRQGYDDGVSDFEEEELNGELHHVAR